MALPVRWARVEILSGVTGLLGDFRGVVVYLGTAALAAQIRWTPRTTGYAFLATFALVALALFWTSVKFEYREMATGGGDSQALQTAVIDRAGYMLGRVAGVADIDWGLADAVSHVFLPAAGQRCRATTAASAWTAPSRVRPVGDGKSPFSNATRTASWT
jgi:hypothetical protein